MNRPAFLTQRLAACLGFFLLALTPFAARADADTIRSADNAMWVSVGGDMFSYKEPSDRAGYLPDSEHGWIPTGSFGASMLGSDEATGIARNLYMSFETTYAEGDVDYLGAYLSTPSVPLHSTSTASVWTINGKMGRAFPLNNFAMLIPYGELGYRYWNRDLGNGQVEDYQHGEVLAGLMGQFAPNSTLVFTGYGAAGTTFAARMDADSSKFDLGSRGVYKAGGKLGINLTPKIEVFTALDYLHFNYGKSGVVGGYYEPNSHTEETKYSVGLSYHFR